MSLNKPTQLQITLVFDDDPSQNQTSYIDLMNFSQLYMDQVPILAEPEIIGAKSHKIKQIKYVITVEYENGLEIEENDDASSDSQS